VALANAVLDQTAARLALAVLDERNTHRFRRAIELAEKIVGGPSSVSARGRV
jgi:hypothetical protein